MPITLEGYRPHGEKTVKFRLKQDANSRFNVLRLGSEEITSQLFFDVCVEHCLAYEKSCSGVSMVSAWSEILESKGGQVVINEKCLIPGKTVEVSEEGIKLQ